MSSTSWPKLPMRRSETYPRGLTSLGAIKAGDEKFVTMVAELSVAAFFAPTSLGPGNR
jgi:hypothetical protein